MGTTKTTLQHVEEVLDEATQTLFKFPRICAVGIVNDDDQFVLGVIQRKDIAEAASTGSPPKSFRGIPIWYRDDESLAKAQAEQIPCAQAASSGIPEQTELRPVVYGSQIQNWDHDDRPPTPQPGTMTVGTLGCIVHADGSPAILSNNHVIAGKNEGKSGDKILQQGGQNFSTSQYIGELSEFVSLQFNPQGVSPLDQNSPLWNTVDVALAKLKENVNFEYGYHTCRSLNAPTKSGSPSIGMTVSKVGRSTGETHGEIFMAQTILPVDYNPEICWFKEVFSIRSTDGNVFAEKGDSGSIIIHKTGGEIEAVGLLFAVSGDIGYAIPMPTVLEKLNATIDFRTS